MDLSDAEIAAASLPSIGLAIPMMDTKSQIEVAEGGITTRKRRSKRIHIAMPVIVRANNGERPIEEVTKTLRVNAHGCLLYLITTLQMGRQVFLVNPATREEIACTVNFLGKKDGEATEVGLEFIQPAPFFWRIHFPPEDWNPEDRKLPSPTRPQSHPLPRR
jgi:hypothetical protein